MTPQKQPKPAGVPQWQHEMMSLVLRVGLFVLIVLVGANLFPILLIPLADYYAGATLTVFATGSVANAISYRVYERSTLMEAGLEWTIAGRRNLMLGLAMGVGIGALTVIVLVVCGLARIESTGPVSWSSLIFVTVLLLFGAVGEELMFRGYAFQLLAAKIGKFATLLPMAVLFGLVHMNNVGATPLSVINTILWGLLLGYAALKSHGLWLPVGMHYGWNWILPLLGADLSGFKMGVTGLRLNAPETSWAGGAYGPEASLVLTLLLPGLFYLLYRMPVPRQQALLLRGVED
ncbi:MAG TPA: type II CAAX endopeptidase family protein [Bryobacteraceae bacterium]